MRVVGFKVNRYSILNVGVPICMCVSLYVSYKSTSLLIFLSINTYVYPMLTYLTLFSTLPGSRRSARLSRRTLSNSSSNEVSASLDGSGGSQKRGKTTRKKDKDIKTDQKEEENIEDKERWANRKSTGYVFSI